MFWNSKKEETAAPESGQAPAAKETRAFKAEIGEMLDLVINSLYSKKEIFLRELVSNASDAIDKAKYLALTDKSIAADNPEWRIDIIADKDKKTLTVSDNGMGMSASDMEQNLGTIASSGTKAFAEALKKDGGKNLPELIGQFGVGFYAAFMVADSVSVVSRKRDGSDAAEWTSTGKGEYSIGPAKKESYGTEITLHLREDQLEYTGQWRIENLIRSYSDFIAYPIRFGEKGEKPKDDAKPLNTMKALWRRSKSEVKPEEYAEFYKHFTHDYDEPAKTIHFSGEGAVEFKALVFIPKKAGMEIYMPQTKRGLSLYVRNVFIGDDFEMLLPEWLRFVKGVVDSSDLPLNVSREMLQDDATIRKIKQAVTGKILSTLEEMASKTPGDYEKFFSEFGRILKEGARSDWENSDRIKKLLLFPSAKSGPGKTISLADYVKAMPSSQNEIYYLAADRIEDARSAPQIEAALKHGCDVLFFTDPVDEWLLESLRDFEGKKLVNAAASDTVFGGIAEREAEKKSIEEAAAELKPFVEAVRERLKDSVKDVKISSRLTDSPCCLVSEPDAISPSMARIMRAMKQEVPEQKRILELNPSHPLVKKLAGLDGAERDDLVELLYGTALVAEGSPVPDAGKFAKQVAALMLK